MMTQDQVFWYENRSDERREQKEKDLKACLEAFQPLVKDALEHLEYAEAKGWFSMSETEKKETALRNSVSQVVGNLVKWGIVEARHMAFAILEEVNDHFGAEMFKQLFLKQIAKP